MGYRIALANLESGRINVAAQATGMARTAFEAAAYHAASAGAVIGEVAPAAILAAGAKLPQHTPKKEEVREMQHEVALLSAPLFERLGEYRTLTRESLARGKSIFLVAPTILEAERLFEETRRGIEDRAIIFHGAVGTKALCERFASAAGSAHPMLVVGTPAILSIPRDDLGTIILERETSRGYERDERPFLSYTRFADLLAKNTGARLVLGATTPSVLSMHRKILHEAQEYGIATGRLVGPSPLIIDTGRRRREKESREKEGGGFDPIPPELHEFIARAHREKAPLLLIAARRGVAPLTVCDDCGAVLSCATCSTPLVLHEEGGRRFLCHFCEQVEEASVRCRRCESWRLTTLGLGVERIAESYLKRYGDAFAIASHDHLKPERIPELIEAFLTGKIPVIIGTEYLVPYLPDSCARIAVVSVDSLLAIAEYTATERAFILLAELRSKAKDAFLIATRQPRHPAIRGIEGQTSLLYREELAERERFSYPPFSTIVKVTLSGKGESFARNLRGVAGALAPYAPILLDARPKRKGEKRMHVILKTKEMRLTPVLLQTLRNLPSHMQVRINPHRIVGD